MKRKNLIICITGVLTLGIAVFVFASNILGLAENESKFDKMVKVIESKITDPDQFNDILYNYKFIEHGYNAPQEHLDYIADLVIGGYDIEDVLSVYYFWMDTSEGIEIVEKMCQIKSERELRSSNWAEIAFNIITDEKCGVLNLEDINGYYEKGLAYEDIATANILCRKGVLTIQQILEKRLEGATFDDIKNMISSESISKAGFVIDENKIKDEDYSIQANIRKELKSKKLFKKSKIDEELNGEAYKQRREKIKKQANVSDKQAEELMEEESYEDILNAMESKKGEKLDKRRIKDTIKESRDVGNWGEYMRRRQGQ